MVALFGIPGSGLPVFRTNVAPGVCWDASTVDDDSKDDESCASQDLDDTNDELDLFWSVGCAVWAIQGDSYLAISLHSEELNDNKQEEQRNDPGGVVDIF